MRWGVNLFILFQLGFLTVSASFIIYNTVFPIYKRLRDEVRKRIPNEFLLDDKKLIISTPAGLHGFYLMGVAAYLKDNYDLSEFSYSGASAGSWNSLFLSFKGNNTEFIDTILNSEIYNATSINQIEKIVKKTVLTKYTNQSDLFDINKITIGVTTYEFPFKFRLKIYDDFETLEDIVDCCIASSHIPFITGNILHRYKNKFTFDGGFFKYPYITTIQPTLIITPSMWGSNFTKSNSYQNPLKYSKNNVNFTRLYEEGYNDTKNNRKNLNKLFVLKKKYKQE